MKGKTIRYFIFSLILSGFALIGRGETYMEVLENGMTLIHQRTRANQIVGVVCMARTGSAYESYDKNGLTNLVQSLLMKGTKRYTAPRIALALESQGISMDTDSSEDYASLSALATLDQLDMVLEFMSEILFHPSFPPDEIEKERKNIIAQINLQEDSKFELGFKNLRQLVFEGDPYSASPEGTPETLRNIAPSDIADFHRRYYQPSNMILSIAGDVPIGKLKKSLHRYFGKIKSAGAQIPSYHKTIRVSSKNREIRKPLEQGFIMFGYLGIPMSHKDYPALRVACAILGEGMASRLFARLRDEQGLAYVVQSLYFNLQRHGAVIGYIGARPETLSESKSGMRKIFEELADHPPSPEELDRAKNYITGKFLVAHQTNLKKAFYPAWFELYGLGAGFDEKYPDLIRSVTIKDVRRVARKYFTNPGIVTLMPQNPPKEK
ncbi:insulinase family protein [Candidatus Sumerlaeota bacterium]|nr:insulinase family protein [Candidatus Sumerlaeota bacterium]